MYYLRNYETIIYSNGSYVHIPTTLTKPDCYGIMKRNHVYLTPSYDDTYVTQYNNTRAIKHPVLDLWCVEFQTLSGLNPVYASFIESKESLEADGWIIGEISEVEFIPYAEMENIPTLEDRVIAIEDVMMMLLV